ncbi:UDP-glucose--hexose-1-phosphate uridylyltransferase [Niallia sp. XMNu-256]|uniref:UDP-glucose--hexose-1-phosphate uridylyltransferase n=1 Tax=Niallia sp. XMNu-256 TaxID=3082444 RepID=UPI0030D58E2C
MEVYSTIQGLVQGAVSAGLIQKEDQLYARNQVLAHLRLDSFPEAVPAIPEKDLPDLVEELTNYAVQQGLIPDVLDEKEILSSKIMNVFISKPSEVNQTFFEKFVRDPQIATNYFYRLSQCSNYIQTKRIAKNIHYKAETAYGELDITINLSKPEKDPKQIALEKESKLTDIHYPKCQLCIENEGYAGRIGHPARSNHRMIRMEMSGEDWYLQYSPYVYYNEHCIVLAGEHRDMVINRETFVRLLDFVGKFPHYFIGSNADLPIVGGSILTHDHYQGGNYEFAMAIAEEEHVFTIKNFPGVHAATVKWPMSVIRLQGETPEKLVAAADYIFEAWKNYSDPEVEIVAYSGKTRHNTITPIARRRNDEYELDLVLRNNRTTEQYPLGIFHPHPDVHHIKKENIGLIEVMGLAVLPARLKTELAEVEKFLLNKENDIPPYHIAWAEEIKKHHSNLNEETVNKIIQKEVGRKFLRVLEDAGVFKRNQQGQQAFQRFLTTL